MSDYQYFHPFSDIEFEKFGNQVLEYHFLHFIDEGTF